MAVVPYTQVSSASAAGLVTDGNALAQTEQSNLSESNYELLRDGTRRRRRPIVQESFDLNTSLLEVYEENATSVYMWKTPAFRDNLSILCEELDGFVRFYKVDHDNPQFVRQNKYDDELLLRLFNNVYQPINPPERRGCTYTEGNGCLYVFNNLHGTIRVELLDDDTLRMTPVGTWVRDYRGSSEDIGLSFRPPYEDKGGAYDANAPFIDGTDPVKINASLPASRAYNLSNSGWDAKAVYAFAEQSGFGEWPANTDRYLAGRKVQADGSDTFSYQQLIDARENQSMAPIGARICDSRYCPAGSLVGRPSDTEVVVESFSNPFPGTTTYLKFSFDQKVVHKESSERLYLFIHFLTYTTVIGGKTFQGGFTGVLPGNYLAGGGGKDVAVQIFNGGTYFHDDPTLQITGCYAHPSPEYFPHGLDGEDNGFSYFGSGRRPSSGAFYAGRLWQTADVHNRLYYSQVLETATSQSNDRGVVTESLCFSEANPTDGDDNAVVPSDGGYVNTNDSGNHYGLIPLGDSLVLLTDRGVWAIRPGTSGVFTASNYVFSKVAEVEVLGPKAWTTAGNAIHVATDEGILAISMEATSFGNTSLVVSRMLDNRLMNEYSDIVKVWELPCAVYDPETRTVRWAFNNKGIRLESTELERQQPMLSYSINQDAWYKYEMGAAGRVIDMLTMPYTAVNSSYNRFRYLIARPGTTRIQVHWGAEVGYNRGVPQWVEEGHIPQEKFSDYRRGTVEPVIPREPVPAHMLTNHMLPGQGIQWSQINYIVVHNRNVTESFRQDNGLFVPDTEGGTLLSIRWDWADQRATGKWSHPYQTYRYRRSRIPQEDVFIQDNNIGEPVLVHKMKLRGRGREFRLYFESDGHKDSHLEGWAYQGYVLNEV